MAKAQRMVVMDKLSSSASWQMMFIESMMMFTPFVV